MCRLLIVSPRYAHDKQIRSPKTVCNSHVRALYKRAFIRDKPNCSGQPIPDSGLSFSSATAGGNPSLN
ncbi:hypothetical protein AO920_33090 [Pseudomonas aeruginosa]|nr:hypothetical protein AO920_33090 [Pseudomonas aeruginosa]